MIAVVGSGRCGTSLMMQTLDLLGVPLAGNPQGRKTHQLWQEYYKTKQRVEPISREYNQKGYYELSLGEVLSSIYSPRDLYSGQAIKYTTEEVTKLDERKLGAIIFCRRRNLKNAARSMHKLADADIRWALENNLDETFTKHYESMLPKDWEEHMRLFNISIEKWMTGIRVPKLQVWFEDFINNPEPIVKNLGDFLSLDNPDISEALKNVNKNETSI